MGEIYPFGRPILNPLSASVGTPGRVPAAGVLGVNYRTLALCCDSRQVSRRMREALLEFQNRGGGEREGGDGVQPPDGGEAALRQRVAELEDENVELQELAGEQARQLEELNHRLAGLEAGRQPDDSARFVAIHDAGANGHDQGDGVAQDWQPPRRRPGMPEAGVVTLEEQTDEEHAFGPAARLVAEWRLVRLVGQAAGSRVDHAVARVRRWELEVRMLRDFHLTLPPETYPLDESRRKDHVRWREEALAEARRELSRAKRARLLRRVMSLGLWRT